MQTLARCKFIMNSKDKSVTFGWKKNIVKSIVLDFILCVHIPLNFVHWNYESQTYLLLTHVTIIQLFLFYNKTESL